MGTVGLRGRRRSGWSVGSCCSGLDVALVRLVGLWPFHGDGQFAPRLAHGRWLVTEPVPKRWGMVPYRLLLIEQLAGLAARRGEHVFHSGGKRNSGRPLATPWRRIYPRRSAAVSARPSARNQARPLPVARTSTAVDVYSHAKTQPGQTTGCLPRSALSRGESYRRQAVGRASSQADRITGRPNAAVSGGHTPADRSACCDRRSGGLARAANMAAVPTGPSSQPLSW